MKMEGKKVELTIDQVEMICNKYCRIWRIWLPMWHSCVS